jgi:hypothetical protein
MSGETNTSCGLCSPPLTCERHFSPSRIQYLCLANGRIEARNGSQQEIPMRMHQAGNPVVRATGSHLILQPQVEADIAEAARRKQIPRNPISPYVQAREPQSIARSSIKPSATSVSASVLNQRWMQPMTLIIEVIKGNVGVNCTHSECLRGLASERSPIYTDHSAVVNLLIVTIDKSRISVQISIHCSLSSLTPRMRGLTHRASALIRQERR